MYKVFEAADIKEALKIVFVAQDYFSRRKFQINSVLFSQSKFLSNCITFSRFFLLNEASLVFPKFYHDFILFVLFLFLHTFRLFRGFRGRLIKKAFFVIFCMGKVHSKVCNFLNFLKKALGNVCTR